jgi:hypothetical protein
MVIPAAAGQLLTLSISGDKLAEFYADSILRQADSNTFDRSKRK